MRTTIDRASDPSRAGAEPHHATTPTGTPSSDPARYALAAVRTTLTQRGRSPIEAAVRDLAARVEDPAHTEVADENDLDEEAHGAAPVRVSADTPTSRDLPRGEPASKPRADLPDDDAALDGRRDRDGAAARIASAGVRIAHLRALLADGRGLRPPETWILATAIADLLGVGVEDGEPAGADVEPGRLPPLDRDAARRKEEEPGGLGSARHRAAEARAAQDPEARRARRQAEESRQRNAEADKALAKGPVKGKPKPANDGKDGAASESPGKPDKPAAKPGQDGVLKVEPPTGGEASGGATVAAWKGRIDARTGTVAAPPVPDGERYVYLYQAATVTVPPQTDQEKRELLAKAKAAVTPMKAYNEGREDSFQLPNDPRSAARQAVDEWVNRRIRKQDLPALQRSPLRSVPEIGTSVQADRDGNKHVMRELAPGRYGEIHVLAPGQKPPEVRGPFDEIRQEKKVEGKGTLVERLKAHNEKEPRNLKLPAARSVGANDWDDLPLEAPTVPNLQGMPKIDATKVLEIALAGVDAHTGKILKDTVAAFPGGKALPDGYIADWRGEVKSDVLAELDKIRGAGNAGNKTLNDKLAAERDKVDQEVKAAHEKVKDAKGEANAEYRTKYEVLGDAIRGLRDDLDRQAEEEAAIAKGGFEAKNIKEDREKFIKANTDKVQTWLGRYDGMRKQRRDHLNTAQAEQVHAYHARAELDRREIEARAGSEEEKKHEPLKSEVAKAVKEISDWETDVIQGEKGVNEKFDDLRDEADTDIDTYTENLTTAGAKYEKAIQEWAREKLGMERSFWAKLLDLVLDWLDLTKEESRVWEARSEENNAHRLSDAEIFLREYQLTHRKELTDADWEAVAHLSEEQQAIVRSFFGKNGGDGAAALAAGLMARLGVQWRPRLHSRLEQKILKGSPELLKAVANEIGPRVEKIVSDLHGGFTGPGTKKQQIFDALRGLTPIQTRAVEFEYEKVHGIPLRAEIEEELHDLGDVLFYGSHDADYARALLAGSRKHADLKDSTKLAKGEAAAIAVQLDQAMKGTFGYGLGTDEKDLLKFLRGKSRREIEAIKREYRERYGRELVATVRGELLDGVSAPWQWEEALALLEHRPEDAEAAALRGSMGHVRTEGPRSHMIVGGVASLLVPGGVLGALPLDDDTILNLVTRDHKAAEEAFKRVQADTAKDAGRYAWDDETYQRQLGIRLKSLNATFGTKYGGEFGALDPAQSALDVAFGKAFSADQAKLLTGILHRDLALESAARVSIEHKAFLPDRSEVDRALADQYQRQYGVDRRDVEAEFRKKKDREWLDCTVKLTDPSGKVLKDKYGQDRIDQTKTNEKRREWGKRWLSKEGAYERKKEADAEAERRALTKAPANMRALKAKYEDPSLGFVSGSIFSQGSFEGDVYSATNVSWAGVKDLFGVEARNADTDKTMALLAQSGYLTGGQQLFFGVYGSGTDEDAVHRAYAGKSPAEIAKMHEDLQKRMNKVGVSKDWTPEAWVKDDFSGRELDDVTVEMEFGEAVTPEQKLRRAERRLELEKKSRKSGVGDVILGSILLGPIAGPVAAEGFAGLRENMARTEMDYLETEVEALRAEIALLEKDKAELAKRGIVEGDAAYYEVINERYDKIGFAAESVDSALAAHRAQVDAIADWATAAIQVVMIVGAIVIGAVVIALSGGTATPAVVAGWTALITAVTTAALTVAAKVIIKGGAYGWEEFAGDVALAVVDAILAYATANVGSTLLRGALLSKLAAGNLVKRLAAHGMANTIEGLIQSIPSTLFSALVNDHADLFGIFTQIGTSAGIAAAMGMKGGLAKPGKFKPGAHGRPTSDVLAYRGTPQDRLNTFKAYQKQHPGTDLKTFLRDFDSQMLAVHKGAFDDAATQRALRKELLEGLPIPQRKRLAGARIEMLSDADFRRAFGDTADPARLLVRDGKPVLVARAGTDLSTLGKQAPDLFVPPPEAGVPKGGKPAVESATPRPRGASASPDPLAPEPGAPSADAPGGVATGPAPRRVIAEPYAGPKLDSPIDLAQRNPGARIVATEAKMRPEPAEVQRLNDAGGTFIPDNKPGHLPIGTVDDIKMRFPLPHDDAVSGEFMRRLHELESMFPNRPKRELFDQAMRDAVHQAETLTAYAPYALERLKAGGTMEVVFWEPHIRGEIPEVGRLTFIDPASGKAYRLELVGLEVTTRGAAAPLSGFGVPGITHDTPVYVAKFRKVELETKLPAGARGPDVVGGAVVGQHSGRPFFPDRAGGPIRELDYSKIRFTEKAVDVVEAHVRRFGGGGEMELAMLDRLRRIARGQLEPTDFDRAFYSHELRESVRYRRIGITEGQQPLDADEAYRVWNDAHTATLEDYKLREQLPGGGRALFHPDIMARFEPTPTGARGPEDVVTFRGRQLLAPGESLEPRIRRRLEQEMRDLGLPTERVRDLSDHELLVRYAEAQVEQGPRRVAEFRATLDRAAQVELDALQAATHLHHEPVQGALAARVSTALDTPVVPDTALRFGEVRVEYKVGRFGNVLGIELRVGPGATLADVMGHVPALAAYKRYQGVTGVVRRVTEAIERLFSRGAQLPVGTRSHEAWVEIQKLPGLIEARRLRVAGHPLDVTTRVHLEDEIQRLERQLARHVADLGDVSPGRGYVAAEGTPKAVRALRERFAPELEFNTGLRERLGQIEQIQNPQERTVALAALRADLEATAVELNAVIRARLRAQELVMTDPQILDRVRSFQRKHWAGGAIRITSGIDLLADFAAMQRTPKARVERTRLVYIGPERIPVYEDQKAGANILVRPAEDYPAIVARLKEHARELGITDAEFGRLLGDFMQTLRPPAGAGPNSDVARRLARAAVLVGRVELGRVGTQAVDLADILARVRALSDLGVISQDMPAALPGYQVTGRPGAAAAARRTVEIVAGKTFEEGTAIAQSAAEMRARYARTAPAQQTVPDLVERAKRLFGFK